MNQKCTFYIIRHGETDWNKNGIIQGKNDISLNEKGRQQANEINTVLKDIHFDAIFSSELLRSRQTAEIIALERKMAIETSNILRERDFGIFEGKPRTELKKAKEKFVNMSDEEIRRSKVAEGYESDEEVITRFITFLREMAILYAGKTVAVVSHGNIMKALLIHLGVLSYKDESNSSVGNTAFAKITSDGVDFWVEEVQGVLQG